MIFAVYAFGVIAGLLAFGRLSDEIGRKPVLVTGIVLSAVSALLFVFADSLAPIYAGRIAALVVGCVLMVGGVGLVALALGVESLAALMVGATVVGLGQGLVIGAGLAAINQRAPVERRSETASSFFVVMYVGLSLPVIGVGVAASSLGLKTAGIAFSAAVAALVLAVLISLIRR
ncbi:MAG TPA: MFS transporter [Gaiellaceae bacterium]